MGNPKGPHLVPGIDKHVVRRKHWARLGEMQPCTVGMTRIFWHQLSGEVALGHAPLSLASPS